jgi:dCMP deaminase
MDESKHNSKTSKLNINKILYLKNNIIKGCYKSRLDIDKSVMLITYIWSQIRSKDPNTKVGSSIYDYDSGALFLGYNGFPVGFPDKVSLWNNRNKDDKHNKYAYVVHAEQNNFIKAINKFNPKTSKMFITNYPCHNCVKNVILPSKIKIICYMDIYPYDEVSDKMLKKLKIKMIKIDL